MFSWAMIFLIVAIIAAVLGFSGLAGAAVNLAWFIALVGVVLAIVYSVRGRGGLH